MLSGIDRHIPSDISHVDRFWNRAIGGKMTQAKIAKAKWNQSGSVENSIRIVRGDRFKEYFFQDNSKLVISECGIVPVAVAN